MWFTIKGNQVELRIFAKPNAKRTALLKVSNDELHISLHAKPHEGEANEELVCYLAKMLKLPKTQVILHRGEGSRHKTVVVPLTADVQAFLTSYHS